MSKTIATITTACAVVYGLIIWPAEAQELCILEILNESQQHYVLWAGNTPIGDSQEARGRWRLPCPLTVQIARPEMTAAPLIEVHLRSSEYKEVEL